MGEFGEGVKKKDVKANSMAHRAEEDEEGEREGGKKKEGED